MRTYEAVFIFNASSDDDALAKAIEAVRAEASNLGGKVSSVTRMGKNSFVRPLKKKESGIFALMVFDMDPANIGALNERYRLSESILRFHIVAAKPGRPAEGAKQEQGEAKS